MILTGNPSGEDNPRRSFFARVCVVLSGIIGAAMALPGVSFVLAPVFRPPPRKWRPVGKVDGFEIGSTELVTFEDTSPLPWAGVTAETGSWLRRVTDESFIAFSINCRHLGCPVRWVEGATLFMCPCHGGVYYSDGTVAAGPPPEALHRFNVRVKNGIVEIETGAIPLTLTKV